MNHRNIRSAVVTLAVVAGLLLTSVPVGAQAQCGWNPMNSGTNEDLHGEWGSGGTVLHHGGACCVYLPLVLKNR